MVAGDAEHPSKATELHSAIELNWEIIAHFYFQSNSGLLILSKEVISKVSILFNFSIIVALPRLPMQK
jgi:hypothetical protein